MDLKLDELASLLDVSEEIIHGWLDDGFIPHYSMNNELRFNREEIEDWLLHNQGMLKSESHKGGKEPLRDGSLRYSLYKAIYHGGVFSGLVVKDKEEVLRVVTSYVAEKFDLDAEVLFELLLDRERLMSTGIGEGIALPHAKDFLIDGYQDIVVPVFLSEGIDFGSLDGQPVSVLFFLFACQDRNHLNLVNKIVNLSVSLEARSFLVKQPSKEQLLAYIKNWESQH